MLSEDKLVNIIDCIDSIINTISVYLLFASRCRTLIDPEGHGYLTYIVCRLHGRQRDCYAARIAVRMYHVS